MNPEQLKLAVQHFSELPDPRTNRGLNQPLINVIVIALCAVLSDADSFYDMEDFGELKRDWLSSFLDLHTGIPSHDTFNRVFARLDPTHFQACVLDWVKEAIGQSLTPGDVLAIDGKSLCGSARPEIKAVHMLNVWSHQHGLCLTSTAVDDKSNEITRLPSVLDTLSLLSLAGCIITVDALGTQREVARKLTSLNAHYVMALKDNHPQLHEDVQWLFEQDAVPEVFETREQGHGRLEIRRCEVLTDLGYLQLHNWPGLQLIARVSTQRTVNEKTSHERRFYLSSLAGRPEQILAAVRQHWEVENKLHWMLDVVFGEDDHRYAKDHGPENLAVLRHMALNLLNREPSKGGMKRKRKRAALSDEFRSTLLMLLLQP